MYGEPRSFGSSFNMNEHLTNAASGPSNVVTREAFERDVNVASTMTESSGSAKTIDSTPMKHSGGAPMANASGAGYDAAKSAYIEPNNGGYQARPRGYDINIPDRVEGFTPQGKQSIRISNYRRNHLKTVTRGLRALT